MRKEITSLKQQQGVILVFSLVLLIILTFLAITLVRMGIIELKIGGASQVSAQNLSNAETSIYTLLTTSTNTGKFYHGNTSNLDTDLSNNYNLSSAQYRHLNNVTLTVEEVACTDYSGINTGNEIGAQSPQAAYFNIRSIAQDTVFSGQSVVNQGVVSIQPAGTCY